MPDSQRATPYPTPGPLGRTFRVLLGGYLLFEFVDIVTNVSPYLDRSGPGETQWLTSAASLSFVALGVGIAAGGHWSRRLLLGVLLLAAVAAGWDLLRHGTVWGAPLGVLLYTIDVLGFGFIGLSLLLAAMLGTPGCEVGALPSLMAARLGRAPAVHACPVGLTLLDRWEAQHRAGATGR